jgi:enterochelin esterase-like enzyme
MVSWRTRPVAVVDCDGEGVTDDDLPAPASTGRHRTLRPWAVVVVAVALVAGGAFVARQLRPVETYGATIVSTQVHSDLLDRDLEQITVLPAGFRKADRRPLLVLLHGRGDSPAGRANGALMEALASAGDAAPAVLLANGGEASYYHDRDDGPWGSYVVDELIAVTVTRYGLNRSRVVYAGISMGGYGALEMVRASAQRQCGVAAMAPALWPSASQTPDGAFDDAEDFVSHDVYGAVADDPAALHGTPVFLVVGEDDPFAPITTRLADRLRAGPSKVEFHTAPGGHDSAFWDAHAREVVAWAASRSARC